MKIHRPCIEGFLYWGNEKAGLRGSRAWKRNSLLKASCIHMLVTPDYYLKRISPYLCVMLFFERHTDPQDIDTIRHHLLLQRNIFEELEYSSDEIELQRVLLYSAQ